MSDPLWNVATLKALLDERDLRYQQRFDSSQEALTAALTAAEKAVAAALAAAKEAVIKAENASEKRFESVNEFRGALTDQAGKMLTRTEADQRFLAINDAILRIEKVQASAGGADSKGESTTRTALSIAAIVISVLVALFAAFSRLPQAS
jgi:Flp pilus assembly protein TadB